MDPSLKYILMRTKSPSWPKHSVPASSWLGNAIEIYDTFPRACDALDRTASDAKRVRGHTIRWVSSSNIADSGVACSESKVTRGLVESHDGKWWLWYVREVECLGMK